MRVRVWMRMGGSARHRAERWARTTELQLKPDVVGWLVDSSGMGRGTIARRMGVGLEELERRVRTGRLTWNAVGRLARCLKRPDSAFLLAEPYRSCTLKDYRGAGIVVGTSAVVGQAAAEAAMTPADLLTVRLARHSQEAAGEMYADVKATRAGSGIERGWQRRCSTVSVDDDPETVAERETERLGLLPPDSFAQRTVPLLAGFDAIRDAVEGSGGALVFQGPMDKDSVRSVVLAPVDVGGDDVDDEGDDGGPEVGKDGRGDGRDMYMQRWMPTPHVILVNAGDAEGTRVFSLLHGYGHMLLGVGGEKKGKGKSAGDAAAASGGCVCKEDGGHRRSRPIPREKMTDAELEEEWCDSFAAAMIMPHGPLSIERDWAEGDTALKSKNLAWHGSTGTRCAAKSLAEKFETSMYAAAVRAIDMPHTRRRERYRRLVAEVANTRGSSSHGRPARTRPGKNPAEHCATRLGREFVRLAVYAHQNELITTHDLIQHLDIRIADIDDVEDAACAWTCQAEAAVGMAPS